MVTVIQCVPPPLPNINRLTISLYVVARRRTHNSYVGIVGPSLQDSVHICKLVFSTSTELAAEVRRAVLCWSAFCRFLTDVRLYGLLYRVCFPCCLLGDDCRLLLLIDHTCYGDMLSSPSTTVHRSFAEEGCRVWVFLVLVVLPSKPSI